MGWQSIDMEGVGEMIWLGGMLEISGSQESHPQAALAGKRSVCWGAEVIWGGSG